MKILDISCENEISSLDSFSIKKISQYLWGMTLPKVDDSSTGPAYYINDDDELVTIPLETTIYKDGKFWSVPSFSNYLANPLSPASQTTGTLGVGNYTVWMRGTGSIAVSGNTATITGAGSATEGTPLHFAVTVAGTVDVVVTEDCTVFQLTDTIFSTEPFFVDGALTFANHAGTTSAPIVTGGTLYTLLSGVDFKAIFKLTPYFNYSDMPVSITKSIFYSGTADILTLSTDANGDGYLNFSDGINTTSIPYDCTYGKEIIIEAPCGSNLIESTNKMQLIVDGRASALTSFSGSFNPGTKLTIGENNSYLFGVTSKFIRLKQRDWKISKAVTIGYSAVGATAYATNDRTRVNLKNLDGSLISAPGMYGNGVVKLYIYLSAGWDKPLRVALYSGVTAPVDLEAISNIITSGFVEGWNIFELPVFVKPGVRYFPAFTYGAGNGSVYHDAMTSGHVFRLAYNELVDPWSTSQATANSIWSVYYTYYPSNYTYSDFEVPGGYTNTGIAYDPVLDCLWSGDHTNGSLRAVNKITGAELLSFDIPDGILHIQGVAYDNTDDTLWVSLNNNGYIYQYTKSGELIKTITTFAGVSLSAALTCIPGTDLLLVGSNASNIIRQVRKSTGAINSYITVPGITDSGGADGVAYDATDNTMWVTQNGDNSVVHCNFDGSTIKIWPNPSPGQQAEGIAIDTTSGLMWYSADAEYHSGVANGNRIWPIEYR